MNKSNLHGNQIKQLIQRISSRPFGLAGIADTSGIIRIKSGNRIRIRIFMDTGFFAQPPEKMNIPK